MNQEGYLVEWATLYLRNMDAVRKSIVAMEVRGSRISVRHKDRVVPCIVAPALGQARLEPGCTIVTFNSAENFKALLDRWKSFVDSKTTLVFVNPFSQPEEKWVVAAHLHDSVCDKSSLRQGLKAMFGTVAVMSKAGLDKLAGL